MSYSNYYIIYGARGGVVFNIYDGRVCREGVDNNRKCTRNNVK